MNALEFLKKMPDAFMPESAENVSCVLQFNISTPAYVTIENGTCVVTEGVSDNPTLTLNVKDDDMIQLMRGKLNGVSALLTGKLRVKGDVVFAKRMNGYFDVTKLQSDS